MRHLLAEYGNHMTASGQGTVARINEAIDFTERLFATNPAYIRDNPLVLAYFKNLKNHDRHYLAHEYFVQDWQAMPVANVAKWLEPAKLSYACSAYYHAHIEEAFLTQEQQQFLQAIPNPIFKETVRDYMTNQQFRHDFWVKGARKISPVEQQELLRKQRVILTVAPAQVSAKILGASQNFEIAAAVYIPILDVLSDHQAKSLGQIEAAVKLAELEFRQILQAVMVFISNGALHPVPENQLISQVKSYAEKLNLHCLQKARFSGEINYLASPVTGGGIAVSQISQLFLLARLQGKKQPKDWAAFVWQILSTQGQLLLKEEKQLMTAEESMAQLQAQANIFSTQELPILKALGIA